MWRSRGILGEETNMANAITGKGSIFDVRPTSEDGPKFAGSIGGILGFGKDLCQGACSGLLGLLGASHMTAGQSAFAPLGSSISWLESLWQNLSATGLAGPVELLGGVVLFLAARRTIARTFGLLGFIAFIVAYANGYSIIDMLAVLSSGLELLAGIVDPSNNGIIEAA